MSRNASKVDRVLCLAVCALAAPAWALESDRQQPMQINSDRFESGMDSKTTVLTGNVRITQGSLVVQAERADVTQEGGEVSRALLSGRPATLKQAMDDGGELNASARTIDYQLGEETVELKGGVVLDRPQGTLRSERVTYSIKTGQLAAGEGVGGGVQLVIPPKVPKAAEPAAMPQG
ncbi:MAG: lipopolysaccharide transport periplasmic protein LptA [Xanthomonadales bacterium]|nr:Lipopolysaccharide export system protein LptA [Xanthomonadales bacterium]MCC6593222.1 lipopolysaccharide transport periplasmic protein LptA [Xanthomonadales bacterium]MCE7929841.1 lipopolysaccharide transport periplasmic protein LptA [Xanthomonadales bacterium PRO6]